MQTKRQSLKVRETLSELMKTMESKLQLASVALIGPQHPGGSGQCVVEGATHGMPVSLTYLVQRLSWLSEDVRVFVTDLTLAG